MYIAVKGGEQAIEASRRLLALSRRGDPAVPALTNDQVEQQLGLLVARVMAEGSLHDPELAALAIRQASGDPVEAAFLLRAYRTTLPRLGFSLPLDTDRMRVSRRVSSIFKDLPGGQVLGPTFDYTQRLLDFDLLRDGQAPVDRGTQPGVEGRPTHENPSSKPGRTPKALAELEREGVVESCRPSPGDPTPPDITREPPTYPMPRTGRLQMLCRADEGWVQSVLSHLLGRFQAALGYDRLC